MMSNTNTKAKKKGMSFGTLMMYFGGGFVVLIVVTIIIIQSMSPQKNKKVVLSKTPVNFEVPANTAPTNTPTVAVTDRLSDLEVLISKMDASDRDAAKFIYAQAHRIDELERIVKEQGDRFAAFEANKKAGDDKKAADMKKAKDKKATQQSAATRANTNTLDTAHNTLGYKVSAVVNKRAWVESTVDGTEQSITIGDQLPIKKSVTVKQVNNESKTVITSVPHTEE